VGLQLYRVTVRGQFADLADATSSKLRAEAADHDGMHARFTPEGTFVYDAPLVSFSFRYEVRVDEDAREDADVAAELVALERAQHHLDAAGITHRRLRCEVTNMADAFARRGGGRPGPRRR
jgi:hypothetical protein